MTWPLQLQIPRKLSRLPTVSGASGGHAKRACESCNRKGRIMVNSGCDQAALQLQAHANYAGDHWPQQMLRVLTSRSCWPQQHLLRPMVISIFCMGLELQGRLATSCAFVLALKPSLAANASLMLVFKGPVSPSLWPDVRRLLAIHQTLCADVHSKQRSSNSNVHAGFKLLFWTLPGLVQQSRWICPSASACCWPTISSHNQMCDYSVSLLFMTRLSHWAQVHLRHLVGGRSRSFMGQLPDERIMTIDFPERPGALRAFLLLTSPRWNISLFHYRKSGMICRSQYPCVTLSENLACTLLSLLGMDPNFKLRAP